MLAYVINQEGVECQLKVNAKVISRAEKELEVLTNVISMGGGGGGGGGGGRVKSKGNGY